MMPDRWSEKRLDSIAELRRGISWSKSDEVEPGEGEPVLSIPNIQPEGLDLTELRYIAVEPDRAERYRGEPRSIVMVGSNGNPDRIGDCAQLPPGRSILFASFLLGLQAKQQVVDPDFLFWAVTGNQLQRQIRAEVQGSTGLQNMSLRTVRSYRLPIPPLPEQRSIAAILSSVDDAISTTRHVIHQTKRVKKGLLQTLMTRGIGHTRFKETEIGEIPENWKVASLRSRLEGDQSGTWGDEAEGSDGTAVIRSLNITAAGRIDLSNIAYRGISERDLERKQLAVGDLLLETSGGGPESPVGRVAIFEGGVGGPAVCTNFMRRLRPDRDEVIPEFLLYLLWMFHERGGTLMYQRRTTGIRNLNREAFLNHEHPFPPVDEQREIVRRINAVEDAATDNEESVEILQALKRGLMQDLLTGRVRVQPD